MRLVLITRRYWPLVGGGEVVMANLASEFHRLGCDVRILTAQWDKRWPLEIVHRDVPVTRLPNPATRAWGTYRYMRSLGRWLRQHRSEFDLVLVSMLKHDAYAAIAALKNLNVPVVCRAEGGGETGDCRWQESGRFGMSIRRKTFSADEFIAPSDSIRDELIAAGYPEGHTRTISNGVAIVEPRTKRRQGDSRLALAEAHQLFAIDPRSPLVLYTGRFHQAKGLDDLIDAWQIVLDRWPNAKLWMLGEGEYGDRLWKKTTSLGLTQSIVFPGTFDELDGILQAADVYALPSYEEGMSIALLEAMSAGVPVVATDIPGNRRLIQNGEQGLLVPVKDPDALAAGILELINDPRLGSRLATSARQNVIDNYSLERMANEHLDLFQQLLKVPSRQ